MYLLTNLHDLKYFEMGIASSDLDMHPNNSGLFYLSKRKDVNHKICNFYPY